MAKILVVDDSFEDLSAIKQALVKEKHVVTTATNGAQALDVVKATTFDLILLDIKMPTLSGYDLFRLLKEKLNGRTKIVFISIVPKGEVDGSGISGFIQKPFSQKSLADGVKKALGNK
ncbi:Chemotaxis protein CheY [Candidatus Gugararchaeum adminiculabundum]|nr:Chemotaxis protein CheY [Candidatus Gugararchaeum adminiculabundum]